MATSKVKLSHFAIFLQICVICCMVVVWNLTIRLYIQMEYKVSKQELNISQKKYLIKDTLIESLNVDREQGISIIQNKNNNYKSNPYKQAISSNVYMYSAILIKDITQEFDGGGNIIIVNGWETMASLNKANFTCCFYGKDNTLFYINSTRKTATFLNSGPYHSVQFECPVDFFSVTKVSVSDGPQYCVENKEYYIKVDTPMKSESGLAVCSKISYGKLDAKRLVEWFEVQRLLGVDKVLAYTYKLNTQAMNVLEYYESIGYAEIIRDFDFPFKEEYPRDAGDQNSHAWADLQVIMHDCQSRLCSYKYVAVLDKDEFLVPNITDYGFSLKRVFDEIFKSNLAGASFLVKMHMTSWKPSNASRELFLGKYLLSTAPMFDRIKYVHMPSRTKYGSVEVHHIKPFGKYKMYAQYIVRIRDDIKSSITTLPVTQLVLHHYRECRTFYGFSKKMYKMNAQQQNILLRNNFTNDKCFGFKTYYQSDMELIIDKIETSVLELHRKLLF